MSEETLVDLLVIIKGNQFSSLFLSCWTKLVQYFTIHNIKFAFGMNDDNNALSMNKILGGSVIKGSNQGLLNEKLFTEKVLILNSEVFFVPEDIQKLLDSDKDIISAFCLGNDCVLASENMNESYFNNNGVYKMMKTEDLKCIINTGDYELSCISLDCVVIKNSVFKSLGYPWFKNNVTKNGNGFYDHEISFCKNVAKMDYTIYGNTSVILGRERLAQIYDKTLFDKLRS